MSFLPGQVVTVNPDFLEDATISEVQDFFLVKDDATITRALRSPIPVSTTLKLLFHNLRDPLGEEEYEIVRNSFFYDYEWLLERQNPTFVLSDMHIIMNTMIGENHGIHRQLESDSAAKRSLHLRVNRYHSHSTLRVDLFVQATCLGMSCTDENFSRVMHDRFEETREKFKDTLVRKGTFRLGAKYFESLSHLSMYDDTLPFLPDDDEIMHYEKPNEHYGLPWWFWVVVAVILVPLAGATIVLVYLAGRKADQSLEKTLTKSITEDSTEAKLAAKKLSPPPSSPIKRAGKVAPLVVTEADSAQKVPTEETKLPTERRNEATTFDLVDEVSV